MAQSSKWSTLLKKAKGTWKDSKESYKSTFGSESLPEDVFVFKLQDLDVKPGKDNAIVLQREHVVREGEFRGTTVRDRFNLSNEWGATFCRRWLAIMGIDQPDDPEELAEILEGLLAEPYTCKGRFSRNNGFPNVDVVSLIDDSDDDGGGNDEDGDGIDLDVMDRADLRDLVDAIPRQ